MHSVFLWICDSVTHVLKINDILLVGDVTAIYKNDIVNKLTFSCVMLKNGQTCMKGLKDR